MMQPISERPGPMTALGWAEQVIKYRESHVGLVRAQMIGGFVSVCMFCPTLIFAINERWADGSGWFAGLVVSSWMTVVMHGRVRRVGLEIDTHVRSLGLAAGGRTETPVVPNL